MRSGYNASEAEQALDRSIGRKDRIILQETFLNSGIIMKNGNVLPVLFQKLKHVLIRICLCAMTMTQQRLSCFLGNRSSLNQYHDHTWPVDKQ